jgi:hypothetical protein
MSPSEAGLLAAVIGQVGAFLLAIATFWTSRKNQEEAVRRERLALKRALEAEYQRVTEIVSSKLLYIREAKDNPLNWARIHTPIWDALVTQGKVGALPGDEAVGYTKFFGHLRWINESLFPLHEWFHREDRGDEFRQHVSAALEGLEKLGPMQIGPQRLDAKLLR